MKKPLLAMFVIGAIAIGLLIVLAIGIFNVDEDGRERPNGAGRTSYESRHRSLDSYDVPSGPHATPRTSPGC